MAELYGICCCSGLTAEQNSVFDILEQELSFSSTCTRETLTDDWYKIGVIAHHRNDYYQIQECDTSRFSYAWIGRNNNIDCKIILEKEDQHKGDFLEKIDPPFAACQIRFDTNKISLISDLFGLYPVYYAYQNGLLIFATKVTPILKSKAINWTLDKHAVLDFFTYEHVTGYKTFADSVQLLPPGSILTFSSRGLEIYRYAASKIDGVFLTTPISELAEMLYEGILSAVSRTFDSNTRLVVTLSGGMDSRALLSCAVALEANIKAVTFGPYDSQEVRCAREVAKACGVPHQSFNINGSFLAQWLEHGIRVTDGMVNSIHYHILSLADYVSKEADVVLDGLSGDALLGGNLSWRMATARTQERAIDLVYNRRATGWVMQAQHGEIFESDFLATTCYDPKEAVYNNFREYGAASRPWIKCHNFEIYERQRRFTQFGPHQFRPFVAVETPFFSPEVIDLVTKLPLTHLKEQRLYLKMYAKYLTKVAAIRDSARGVPLSWPLPVRFTKKALDFSRRRLPNDVQRFFGSQSEPATDYCHWFRTELHSFLRERLLDDTNCLTGIIRRSTVERLINEHYSGLLDHHVKLGCLLTFSAWMQKTKDIYPACKQHGVEMHTRQLKT